MENRLLIRDLPYMTDEGKIKRVSAEAGDKTHRWLRLAQKTRDLCCRLLRHFEQCLLNCIGVRIIAHAHGNQDCHASLGQVVIRDHALRKLAVRHDDHIIRQHAYSRRAPADILHIPLLPCFEFDEIAYPYGMFGENMDACEEIGEGVLESKGHGKTADAKGRDNWRN